MCIVRVPLVVFVVRVKPVVCIGVRPQLGSCGGVGHSLHPLPRRRPAPSPVWVPQGTAHQPRRRQGFDQEPLEQGHRDRIADDPVELRRRHRTCKKGPDPAAITTLK